MEASSAKLGGRRSGEVGSHVTIHLKYSKCDGGKKVKLKAVRNIVLSFQTCASMFEGEDLGNGGGNLEQQLQQDQLKMEHIAQVLSAEYMLFLFTLAFHPQLHKLNELCWDTCIRAPSSSLTSRDNTCLTNCVNRFIDTTLFITNRFSNIAQKMSNN